MISMATRRPAS